MHLLDVVIVSAFDCTRLKKTLESFISLDTKDIRLILVIPSSDLKSLNLINSSIFTQIRFAITILNDEGTGIYQAMNIGVRKSNARYLTFLNSGDTCFQKNSLDSIQQLLLKANDEIIISIPHRNWTRQQDNTYVNLIGFLSLENGSWISHQGIFFSSKSIKEFEGFDERYIVAADTDLILKYLVRKKLSPKLSDLILFEIEKPLFSSLHHRKSRFEVFLIYIRLKNTLVGKLGLKNIILREFRGILAKLPFNAVSLFSQLVPRTSIRVWPILPAPGRSGLVPSNYEFSLRTISRNYHLRANNFVIVGANDGEEILTLRNLRCKRIFLIEPTSSAFARLQARISSQSFVFRSKCLALNLAAADFRGEVQIFIGSNSEQSSSLLRPRKHLDYEKDITFHDAELVQVSTLNEIIPKDVKMHFLQIDTQGTELSVLKGLSNRIGDVRYLLIELNREENYSGCVQVEELDYYLLVRGFRRVLTRWWNSWGDGLYSQKGLTPTLRNVLRRF